MAAKSSKFTPDFTTAFSDNSANEALSVLWEKLDKGVARLSGALVISGEGPPRYRIRLLDRHYEVDSGCRTVHQVLEDENLSKEDAGFETALVILSHLTSPEEAEPSGRWVSEKELKGGTMFFRGVHALPLEPLVKRFGRDSRSFQEAGRFLGARKEPFGDASFSLQILPGVPLAFILWVADEEFPDRVSVLFDAGIELRFPLDVILALVRVTIRRILEIDASANPISY
ncbi:MAG: DUF3786 domain-containing protein [Deltaproteobacteria bacterium]|nr:DUF3786 domain-containing protein [Deltaproteobacteria bacterium]